LQRKQVFDTRHRVAQHAVRVIQVRAVLDRVLLLMLARVYEFVGMQLPAQLQKFLLERRHFDPQLARDLEEVEIVALLWLCCGWCAHIAHSSRYKTQQLNPQAACRSVFGNKKSGWRAAANHWFESACAA